MPCSTTLSSTGNCSTICWTSASVRSLGGSSVLKVRIHVWHSESQRFVVSRYRVRGKVGTSAGRFDMSIADLQVVDILARRHCVGAGKGLRPSADTVAESVETFT